MPVSAVTLAWEGRDWAWLPSARWDTGQASVNPVADDSLEKDIFAFTLQMLASTAVLDPGYPKEHQIQSLASGGLV